MSNIREIFRDAVCDYRSNDIEKARLASACLAVIHDTGEIDKDDENCGADVGAILGKIRIIGLTYARAAELLLQHIKTTA